MYVYIVKNIIEYESQMTVAVFDDETKARDYAREADLFTDGRSIERAELNNTESLPEQIAFKWRDKKGEF